MQRTFIKLLFIMSWTQHLKAELSRPASLMETIRKSADAVMSRHRSGGTEAMYHRSMEVEMYYKGICCLSEVDCYMMSGSVPIQVGQLDMEVDHKVILELKVAPKITIQHIQQLRKYVRARASTGMNVEGAAVICFTDKDRVEFLELDVPQTKSPFFKLSRTDAGGD